MGELRHIWPKRIEASEFLECGFTGKKKPHLTTITRWLANGHLPGGEKIGSKWYVWVDQGLNAVDPVKPDTLSVVNTGNAQADQMLGNYLSRTAT